MFNTCLKTCLKRLSEERKFQDCQKKHIIKFIFKQTRNVCVEFCSTSKLLDSASVVISANVVCSSQNMDDLCLTAIHLRLVTRLFDYGFGSLNHL